MTFSSWSLEAWAPIMVATSRGSPETIASTRAVASSMNSS